MDTIPSVPCSGYYDLGLLTKQSKSISKTASISCLVLHKVVCTCTMLLTQTKSKEWPKWKQTSPVGLCIHTEVHRALEGQMESDLETVECTLGPSFP